MDGVIELGTHASLIRRHNGNFLLLDSYSLTGSTKQQVAELTDDGTRIEAILNLHPFHTLHVPAMHKLFPNARLFGSKRHVAKAPELNWENLLINDPGFSSLFEEDLEFSIPSGVDFISNDEQVHFSSVLAFHRASRTIHSDDTLMYFEAPFSGFDAGVQFHPTLGKALRRDAGAAIEFWQWAQSFADDWGHSQNLCAAHRREFLTNKPMRHHIEAALKSCENTLREHERKYG